jgi:type III secretory pathway component EscU
MYVGVRLADLESTCKVIFDLIHVYVFWFIKVFTYNTFQMFTYCEAGWLVLVWSSQDFLLHVLAIVQKTATTFNNL